MENATKALIMAGSILISVLVIAVAIYIFQRGQMLSDGTTSRAETAEIQAFNAQFNGYETLWNYGNVIPNGDTGNNARYMAPSSLNKISDVISAVNLAVSVNSQNNYGYNFVDTRNGYIETVNAVEIIIDMSLNTPSGLNRYYLIEPNENVKTNCIYGTNSIPSADLTPAGRSARVSRFTSSFSTFTEIRCNDLLVALNENKLVSFNNSNYTLYKYYFVGEYQISETTGKIDSVKFTLVYDDGFDRL